ncbi:mtN3/saliva family protein [Teladorsagia circumcincta]|uniref:Sugar transporter SWEET1 n=1 Tax=Teladorsagia circumcincta TaxID=45464 RepID=A0A2G9TZB0_TELCI|nr:mtN3/saliva family protein [Teladorsagia circumcincta]
MFEVFTHGFSFLNCLSLAAFFTTVALFFCGIPICRQIWKRRDTKEISGAPFLMGVLGGCCWMTYGYLKNDQTVLVVTACQVLLYSIYCVFYWFMSRDKRSSLKSKKTTMMRTPPISLELIVGRKSSSFMYSQTIDDDDTASEKTMDTVDGQTAKNLLEALKNGQQVLNPDMLMSSMKLTSGSTRLFADARRAKIRRVSSSPDLTDVTVLP